MNYCKEKVGTLVLSSLLEDLVKARGGSPGQSVATVGLTGTFRIPAWLSDHTISKECCVKMGPKRKDWSFPMIPLSPTTGPQPQLSNPQAPCGLKMPLAALPAAPGLRAVERGARS